MSPIDPDRLFAPVADEKTIGLAVSGGADSLALMVLYHRWWRAGADRPKPIVYTVDHRLRPEAADEAAMVARLAGGMGMRARILEWSGAKPSSGTQQAARVARYRLMGQAMAADGVSVLLTAHHADDQAETVMMRLAHGSGVRGLGGMRAFARIECVHIFRPLLAVPRAALAAIVAQAGLTPAADPSNDDPAYERVRWRRALAKELAGLGIAAEGLGRLAARMRRIDALAQGVADRFWASAVEIDPLGVIEIDRGALWDAGEETVIRILARAIDWAGAGGHEKLAAIELLADQIGGPEDGAWTLGGAKVRRAGDRVEIFREAGRNGLETEAIAEGSALVWDRRFVIESAVAATVAPAREVTRERFCTLVGHPLDAPVAALAAAPLVTDGTGAVLALGAHVLSDAVSVRLTEPEGAMSR